MGRSCLHSSRFLSKRLKMKYLILLALFGAAFAGPASSGNGTEEGKPEKPEWMDSFRLRVEFLCKVDKINGEQWKKVRLPRWVQQVVESKDMEKIQGLCFNVDAHISTMKRFHRLAKGCDPIRVMHFMKASMHHFHKFCLIGKGYDKCLGELFGKDGTTGKIGECVMEKKVNPMLQEAEACGATMKAVEKCVGDSDVCKDEKGMELREFKENLHERIDRIMCRKGKNRHVETCKMMKKMFATKMGDKIKEKMDEQQDPAEEDEEDDQ